MTANASSRSASRIPVKIHRNVEILLADDPFLATELLRNPKIAPYIALPLTDMALLILPHQADEFVAMLRQAGYPARVVHGRESDTSAPVAVRNTQP